ncbi:GTP pyrophosphokinase [Lachnospiraceae bacterium NSJ-143]|nr:GTP pyrophosphokinase [Lachnospiraceae bacterium NSJ-143]
MIYSEKVKEAALIAYRAHSGDTDKGGYPYILHPVHLAEGMQTEAETITALLHDVAEDSDITIEELESCGFGEDIISALRLLTRSPEEEYMEYILRIKNAGGIALSVKRADIEHNMDTRRLENAGRREKARVEKYRAALALLNS